MNEILGLPKDPEECGGCSVGRVVPRREETRKEVARGEMGGLDDGSG